MSQSIPPPRRKSCKACVKAKRRCDLLTPQCSRCFQKSLDCIYEGQPPKRRQHAPNPANALTTLSIPYAAITAPSDPSIQPMPSFMDLPELNFEAASYEMPLDFNAGSEFMEFIPQLPLPPFPEDYPTPETAAASDTSTKIYSHEDYDHVEDICVCGMTCLPSKHSR